MFIWKTPCVLLGDYGCHGECGMNSILAQIIYVLCCFSLLGFYLSDEKPYQHYLDYVIAQRTRRNKKKGTEGERGCDVIKSWAVNPSISKVTSHFLQKRSSLLLNFLKIPVGYTKILINKIKLFNRLLRNVWHYWLMSVKHVIHNKVTDR